MKIIKYFICLSYIIIILLVDIQAQERDSLIQLYSGLGDTVDNFDAKYFELFQNIDGFYHAVFYVRNKQRLVSKVTYSENGLTRDTTFIQPLTTLDKVRFNIDRIVEENEEKLESKNEVEIVTRKGESKSGKLEMFNKKYLYLQLESNIDENWIEKRSKKIAISNINSIVILGESKVWSSMGWGTLIGLLLGGVIGFASGDDEKGLFRFEKEEKALGLGIFLGLVGGLAGLIAGLSSSTDDEIIQFNQKDDVMKLKRYAKYYFSYDQSVEEQYVEIK